MKKNQCILFLFLSLIGLNSFGETLQFRSAKDIDILERAGSISQGEAKEIRNLWNTSQNRKRKFKEKLVKILTPSVVGGGVFLGTTLLTGGYMMHRFRKEFPELFTLEINPAHVDNFAFVGIAFFGMMIEAALKGMAIVGLTTASAAAGGTVGAVTGSTSAGLTYYATKKMYPSSEAFVLKLDLIPVEGELDRKVVF